MQPADYLARIEYTGPFCPTLPVLRAIHRAHLTHIPYENLDIHLDRPLVLDLPTVFDKLVTRRRGGWCYEMNGLLAWALRELGFRVSMLSAAVNPGDETARANRDHLVLRIDLDQSWLADTGFGTGFFEPLPLHAGSHRQGFHMHSLTSEGSYWVYRNDPSIGNCFVFSENPREWHDFADRAQWLQTSPASWFTTLTASFRRRPDGVIQSLRGRVLTLYGAFGKERQILETRAAYADVLNTHFGLVFDSAELELLWSKVKVMALP